MSSSPSSFSLSVEELLRQATWVRRVARALVHGHDRVDELEQETWVAALSHPPRHGGDLRRWLSAVARNVSRHLLRSDATREHHERRNAELSITGRGSSVAPAAGAIVARAEVLQRVAAAVLALEEPYRSVLLARYFDELPPTEIARALDISVETVKTRLKRGLAQMRERLESLRPEGTTLEAMLLPLCGPAVGAAVPVVTKGLLVAATLAIGATIATFAWNPTSRVKPAPGLPIASTVAREPLDSTSPPTPDATGTSDANRAVARPAAAATIPKSRAPVPEASARLTGRFLLPDRTPANGVALRLEGWNAMDTEDARDQIDVDRTTGSDGTFSIDFHISAHGSFRFRASLAGYAERRWDSTADLKPGVVLDLGEVTLPRAGTIRVRIVDAEGSVVKGEGWSVSAMGPSDDLGPGMQPTYVWGDLDPATQEWVLRDVAPGRNQLDALWNRTHVEGPVVLVQHDQVSQADIAYLGADLARSIRVEMSTSHPVLLLHRTAEVVLTGSGREWRAVIQGWPSGPGFTSFDDLPDGEYSVEVRSKDCMTFTQSRVAPGTCVDAKLIGNAKVLLHVSDAISGDPIDRYTLDVVFPDLISSHPFVRLRDTEVPPADGVFDGLWPRDQMLVVRAKGFAPGTAKLFHLLPDQITEVSVRLSQGATLAGFVFQSDGKAPSAGTEVHLAHAEKHDSDDPPFSVEGIFAMQDERVARTDGSGGFEFQNVGPGRYRIETAEEPPLQTALDGVEVVDSDTYLGDLDLVLPARGFLSGKIVATAETGFGGIFVTAHPPGDDGVDEGDWNSLPLGALMSEERARATVGPDGAFRVGPLKSGVNVVSLLLPEFDVPASDPLTGIRSGPAISLGTVTILDGQEAHAEFDVRDRMPGSVRVVVTEQGQRVVDAVVELVRSTTMTGTGGKHRSYESVAAGRVREDGFAMIERVPVGAVQCVVHAKDASWTWWSEGWITIRSNTVAETAIDFTLHAGQLHMNDLNSGLPLGTHEFRIGRRNGDWVDQAIVVKSDANGVVRLRLASGQYLIAESTSSSWEDSWVRFDWTEDGAAVDSVSVDVRAGAEIGK